jgi:predicted kinase
MDELQQKTSEWNIAGKKRKDRPTPQRKPWKLPSVKYIPPPPDGDPQFEPFMLLLVGLPGSGKSTFAKALIEAMPYKVRESQILLRSFLRYSLKLFNLLPRLCLRQFTRINQDELGNRQKCEAKARMALDEGKCPIIDRCNFDQSQRQKWFDIAKEKGGIPVDCITLHLPVGLCIRRCEQRTNHETVAPSQARAIINKIKQQYRPPGKKEPFRRLDYVKDSDAFNSILEQCLDR